MALLEWNKNMHSVGNERFDNDHKKLLSFINELHQAMLEGKGKEKLSSILSELQEYTHYHFNAEEKAMERANYPGLAEHKNLHTQLKEELAQRISDLENNKMEVSIETNNFLKEWLFNHIQMVDKKYTPWLK